MNIVNKIFFSLISLFVATPAFAQEEPPKLEDGIDTIVDNGVALIFPVAGLACVVFIIIGGYTWIISAGDPAKVKQAQGTLTWAIIGLIFILIAGAIVSTLTDFLK